MPPPMPNPAKRMTANPAKPIGRYRPGKPVAEVPSSDEEDEEDEVDVAQERKQQKPTQQQSKTPIARLQAPARKDPSEDEDEEGFVTDEEDEDADGGAPLPKSEEALESTNFDASSRLQHTSTTSDSEESDEEQSDEDESSEEESSSEDEPQRKFQRPTFIKKTDRKQTNPSTTAGHPQPSNGTISSDTPADDDALRRRAQADLMIKDKLERDAQARLMGKKSWDDDDDLAPEDMVDDTDGLDPDAEYAAWKLRELKRLKRDREIIEAREKEIEEIERRRNLTTAERAAEDAEHISKQKEEKEGRSKAKFLQRYHHSGAFFQDDEAAARLAQREIMGAKFADEVDTSTLPQYMQIRDMTKLGKKGRTRYTDLKGEDTGRFGDEVKRWLPEQSRRGGFNVVKGADERFLPDRDGGGHNGPSGANASMLGTRDRGERRQSSRSPPRNQDDSYRPKRRSYSRSVSRSRSPPRRRRRSPSPYRDRDKRRRMESA